MAQIHIEQFFSMAFKDPRLVAKMQQGTGGPENFIGKAVRIAREHGYEFSAMEATAWIEQQQKAMAPGELSSAQLDVVAGGITDLSNREALQTSQREAYELLSSISKAMHDASQSIISNIKA